MSKTIDEIGGIVLIIGEEAFARASNGDMYSSRAKFYNVDSYGTSACEFLPPVLLDPKQATPKLMAQLCLIRAALETAETSQL